MRSRMNGVDKVTVSVDQNDTSVFLIGDIYNPTTKSQIYHKYSISSTHKYYTRNEVTDSGTFLKPLQAELQL